jgi:predicted acetyltransferase
MLTPTLLDVAAITSLKPTGKTFDHEEYESELSFDFNRFAYEIFIKEHHNTESAKVTDEEHVALFTYWLSMYIFCTRSI